jgi:fructokinase
MTARTVSARPHIVGIGELLWDVFPDKKRPGGAPANVVYHATILGADGFLVSRVGADEAGKEILGFLEKKGLNTTNIQIDRKWPTGRVNIEFTDNGEPDYTIVKPVAWDYIQYSDELEILVKKSDAIIFGTLAQRNKTSAETIDKVLKRSKNETLKVLDVNFRRDGYNKEIVMRSLRHADIVKINEDELKELGRITETDNPVSMMLSKYEIRGICLTKGVDGSIWIDQKNTIEQKAYVSENSNGDPVGLGDGFTAALTLEILKNHSPEQALEKASRYTSMLAEKKGGMPEINKAEVSALFSSDT